MQKQLRKGVEQTAALGPEIERGYAWVHRAARVLAHAAGDDGLLVRRE